MSHATVCPQHGLIPDTDRAAHARLHENQRTQRRADLEPWRALYTTKEWARARAATLRRDQHQCRIEENGQRCEETDNLQVDHLTPLRTLWHVHGDAMNAPFAREATDIGCLITLCPQHHAAIEQARR